MTAEETAGDEEFLDEPPVTALEPPAKIGIIGAGPVAIEAALYARFLGYDVVVWERGEIAGQVTGDATQTFGELTTRLGRQALAAQSSDAVEHADEDVVSVADWRSDYLLPLANTDLIRKVFQAGTSVSSVACKAADLEEDSAEGVGSGSDVFEVSYGDGASETVAAIIDTAGASPFLKTVEFNADRIADAKAALLADALVTSVTNYYVLGAKSWGERRDAFSIADGHEQILALFALIGDRENLNLYGG